MDYTILFLPDNRKVNAQEGENLLKAAMQAGVLIDGSCAGKGTCGKCKVVVLSGNDEALTEEEKHALSDKELQAGYRLACQVKVYSDMTVMIPDIHGNSSRKKKMNRLPEGFQPEMTIKKVFVKLPKATLQQQTNTLTRIRQALDMPELKVNTSALAQIQKASAAKRGKMTAIIYGDTLISAEADNTENTNYGLALDIGTTTVVAMLWDLTTGSMIDAEAATNPQSLYGADVISRIQFCMEEEGNTEKMQSLVLECINGMTAQLCTRNEISPENIYSATMVGNTTMSHLFLGIDPASMARVPFAPVFCEGIHRQAGELGLMINDYADVYVLPNIAGHVGSDITAVMLACDLPKLNGNTVVIDIGTNGEILVASDGQIKACSTAAGPAFEGACIKCGMRAARGAIEKVQIDEDVTLQMIESDVPAGICGSGLIDAVAELVRNGMITGKGNLISRDAALEKGISSKVADRLYGEGNDAGFILYKQREKGKEDIVLTQKDIREVQLAKGAILGGMKTLMKKLNFSEEALDRVIIAGAFGSYISKESAIRMGLLPAVELDKVISIGNGAGTGSAMALLSEVTKEKAEEERKKIEHVELSQDMDFQEYYVKSMFF